MDCMNYFSKTEESLENIAEKYSALESKEALRRRQFHI